MENKKTICLYTGSARTKAVLCKQMQDVLGEGVGILSYAIDEEEPRHESTDLVVLSSKSVEDELLAGSFLTRHMKYVICGRRVNFDNIEGVLQIPKGKTALFVNDTKETTEHCIKNLKDIGINHIGYEPYFPGCELRGNYEYAITAGELWLVPENIKNVIDMGPRHLDISSLIKMADLLELRDFDAGRVIKPYTDKIIEISRKMTVVNVEVEGIKNILKERLESKGHTAEHTFESIRGSSKSLEEVKHRAGKLAKTDLTVLIEGESGTGKELFASAIHNASERKNGPYLAANFSALPEELAESELFGYEEGAFTGAKKGGKTGLFEQADGGTIFLDEIGDISLRMQTKLLRVLQEKEIMPVGGGNIKKVDIRIIAATNKDLKQMVQNGTFRDDLYYRLKIGYVNIPALRERKEDIRCLMEFFAETEEKSHIFIDKEVYHIFLNYDWGGNVRELRNAIKYMMAVREHPSRITVGELPDCRFFQEGEAACNFKETDYQATAVLNEIYEINREGLNAGRLLIAQRLNESGIKLTENQVRKRIELLQEQKLVTVSKGKRGTSLTEKGLKKIEEG